MYILESGVDTFRDRRNRLCKVFFEKNDLSEPSRLSYCRHTVIFVTVKVPDTCNTNRTQRLHYVRETISKFVNYSSFLCVKTTPITEFVCCCFFTVVHLFVFYINPVHGC